MKTTVLVLCVLSTFSMLLYAFTGLTLWSALQPGDTARLFFLCAAHIAPFFALNLISTQ